MTQFRSTGTRLTLLALLGAFALGCQTHTPDPMASANETGSEFHEAPLPVEEKHRVDANLNSIYFDYDQSAIREDARPTLHGNAELIQQHEAWGAVLIEGHCDERGSEEYNMALGKRRAVRVKQYLVDLGVPSHRLQTVSYGEALPAVPGYTEEAFRHNRRSEFKVSDSLAAAR